MMRKVYQQCLLLLVTSQKFVANHLGRLVDKFSVEDKLIFVQTIEQLKSSKSVVRKVPDEINKMTVTLIERLLCARHYSSALHLFTLSSPQTSEIGTILITSFWMRDGDTERLRDVPEVRQHLNSAGISTQAVWLQSLKYCLALPLKIFQNFLGWTEQGGQEFENWQRRRKQVEGRGTSKGTEHSIGMGDNHFGGENGHRNFRHKMSNFKLFSVLFCLCNCSPDFINPNLQ